MTGPTDNTAAIAGSFADERVRVVTLESNSGPGGARNAALALAKGRWIAVLDSDDTVFPDRIAAMITRAENTGAKPPWTISK